MLVELAKPVTLISCILSLYAVFHTAFLIPSSEMDERICDSLGLLALAALISFVSGLIFRYATTPKNDHIAPYGHTSRANIPLGFWHHARSFRCFLVSGEPLHFLS
jgi:hypothetical protein